MRINGFFLFCCACVPGAGQMYLGYMKRGLCLISLFCLNLMFCIAVPTVFCSISSSIANMQSARRAGKIMGVTIATFLVTWYNYFSRRFFLEGARS